MVNNDDVDRFADAPAMPRGERTDIHRQMSPLAYSNACVARPVAKGEVKDNHRAKAATDKEWET